MRICLFSGRKFEDTFENAPWGKVRKCNQCDFASSHAGDLRRHLTKHSGEKYKKCNQCDYVSCYANDLRRHLQRHSGEKSNKCIQCGFASSYSNFKDTFENAQWGKVEQIQPVMQFLWDHTCKRTVEKSQTNASVWLCIIFSDRPFEDTFEKAQLRKVKQMQPM